MKRFYLTFLLSACIFFSTILTVQAGDKATPEEVVQKVREAAAFLAQAGDAGLAEFMDRDGRWVWKDTYVWVLHCAEHTDAAHPIKPKLVGAKLDIIKDRNGKFFFAEFCKVAGNPNGGWVDYLWPKVGERKPSRKITYILQVPGSPYQVGAGIYDEDMTIEDLNRMTE